MHDQNKFLSDVSRFVEEVGGDDYLNMFLADIGWAWNNLNLVYYSAQGRQTVEDDCILNVVCATVRSELMQRDPNQYITTILATHVFQRAPDYVSALSVLQLARG